MATKPKNDSNPQKGAADTKQQAPKAEVVLGDFDPRVVHHRDPKTGRVIRSNPFKMIVERGIRYFEHPVGSGNLYHEDRMPAGRLVNGNVVPGAAHELWSPPLTADQKVARDHAQLQQENERLRKELDAIEREKKFPVGEVKSDVKK